MVETILTLLFMIVVPGGIPIVLAWRAWKARGKKIDKIEKSLKENDTALQKLIDTCDRIIKKKDKDKD